MALKVATPSCIAALSGSSTSIAGNLQGSSGSVSSSMTTIMPQHAVGGPVPTQSREGRSMQRYGQHGERLLAGCIPVRSRRTEAGDDAEEVLLVSSRRGKGLVLPKGGWETDETVEAAAQRETVEEAGVRGVLEEPLLGEFPFQSERQHDTVHQGKCVAHMFVMRVAEELEVWPESEQRRRTWVPLPDAARQCRHQWMRDALQAYVRRRGWDLPPCHSGASDVSDERSEASFSRASLELPSQPRTPTSSSCL